MDILRYFVVRLTFGMSLSVLFYLLGWRFTAYVVLAIYIVPFVAHLIIEIAFRNGFRERDVVMSLHISEWKCVSEIIDEMVRRKQLQNEGTQRNHIPYRGWVLMVLYHLQLAREVEERDLEKSTDFLGDGTVWRLNIDGQSRKDKLIEESKDVRPPLFGHISPIAR